MKRKLVWLIPLCFVLGCMTTVIVAWSIYCQVWDSSNFRYELWRYERAPESEDQVFIVHLDWQTAQSIGTITRRRMSHIPQQEADHQVHPPGFLIPHLRTFDLPARSTAVCTSSGWPMLALHEDTLFVRKASTATPAALTLDRSDRGSIDVRIPWVGRRQLPFLPVWRGFLINSLIFAAAWFVLLATPGEVRRLMRQRRGLCLHCGYDLRGDAHDRCPECGQPGVAIR